MESTTVDDSAAENALLYDMDMSVDTADYMEMELRIEEDNVFEDEPDITIPESRIEEDDVFEDDPDITIPEPVLESSIEEDAPVFDAEPEEGPRYSVVEAATKKGQPKLIDRDGFSYTWKKDSANGNKHWRCSYRTKDLYCPATVIEEVDRFRLGLKDHVHPAEPGIHIAIKIAAELETEYLDSNAPDFLRADVKTDTSRHVVMATDIQLKLLENAKTLYLDGTFRVAKKPFVQLFSIHSFIKSGDKLKQVPLVFILMSTRSKADYCQVFNAVKDLVNNLAVQEFVVDFEIATWQAIREVFPGIQIKGCAFHWSQAIFRKIQENGLQVVYNERGDCHNFLRRIMALPFLPAKFIRTVFFEMYRSATDEKVIQVLEYVDRQWMANRVFAVEDWSVFMRPIRTNNDVEGWHNRINSRLNTRGSVPFYLLVQELFKEGMKVKMDMALLTEGKISRCQRSRVGHMHNRVFSLWSDLKDKKINKYQLLRECALMYGPSVDTSE